MWVRLGLAILLGALVVQPVVAQDAATVLLVRSGSVCAGGTDVVWVTEDGRVWRWRKRDQAVSEIKVPPLNTNDRHQGGVQGCVARSDGGLDLYYDEYFNIPGTPLDRIGWDPNQRVQTIWLSAAKQRPLLTISVPEGGFGEDDILIVPALGVTLHSFEFERVADQLKYRIQVPDGAYILGVWPIVRAVPVEPAEIVVCYAFPWAEEKNGGCVSLRISDLAAKVESARSRGIQNAYEYPSRDWEVRLIDSNANRPTAGRLVPAND
jgi:hypothetical protein